MRRSYMEKRARVAYPCNPCLVNDRKSYLEDGQVPSTWPNKITFLLRMRRCYLEDDQVLISDYWPNNKTKLNFLRMRIH